MEYPDTTLTGPVTSYIVAVDGYRVPNLSAIPLRGEQDGITNVILDERFCVCAPNDEARKWIPLIAHALAIGAGYSCHGASSEKLNPHKCKLMEIKL